MSNSIGIADQPAKSLLALPNEVLHQIVSCFDSELQAANGDPQWSKKKTINSQWYKQFLLRGPAIRRLRLTCRRLNNIASPKLVPVLRIRLDLSSLDTTKSLVKNPLIASGILQVTVGLAHFRPDITRDRVEFNRYLKNVLSDLFYGGRLGCALQPSKLEGNCSSVANYYKMIKALEPIEEDEIPEVKAYRRLMAGVFTKVEERQLEQAALKAGGKFATEVGCIIAKLPSVKVIQVADVVDPYYFPFHAREVFTQESLLYRYLLNVPIRAQDASHMSVQRPSMVQLAASIPMAISSTGISVKFLSITCFPKLDKKLFPERHHFYPGKDEYETWKNALSSLEELQLLGFVMDANGSWCLDGRGGNYIRTFIQAAVSGPSFRKLNLDPRPADYLPF